MPKCQPKKCLVVIAVVGGLMGLALAAKRSRSGDTGTGGATMWDKMEEKMAAMPETFPPRIMFDNIAAIREDTTRILEILQVPEDIRSDERQTQSRATRSEGAKDE